MPPQTMTLGLLRVVTRGRDPTIAVADDLATFLHTEHWTTAQACIWVEAAEYESHALPRGDVLWSGLGTIPCAWLHAFPIWQM